MAWVKVNVNGHRYYRRSKRVNGRLVTKHVGCGRLDELDAECDAAKRELDRRDRIFARGKTPPRRDRVRGVLRVGRRSRRARRRPRLG